MLEIGETNIRSLAPSNFSPPENYVNDKIIIKSFTHSYVLKSFVRKTRNYIIRDLSF